MENNIKRSELVVCAVLWMLAAGAIALAVAIAVDVRIPEGAVVDTVSVQNVEGGGCEVFEHYLPPSKYRGLGTSIDVARCQSLVAVRSDSTGELTAMQWFSDRLPVAGTRIEVFYPRGAFEAVRQVEHQSAALWVVASLLLLGAVWSLVSLLRSWLSARHL